MKIWTFWQCTTCYPFNLVYQVHKHNRLDQALTNPHRYRWGFFHAFKSTFRQLGTIGGGSEDSVTVIKRLIGPSSIQFEIVDTIGNLRMVTKDELIELHKTKRIAGVKFVGDKMFVANEVETFIGKN